VKELVVISGKGGTGKTSIVASFAALAKGKVLADCDVDAPDLYLILQPHILRREPFSGGKKARIEPELCTACGICEDVCRFDAVIHQTTESGGAADTFTIDPIACEGCGVCVHFCPEDAIPFEEVVNGEWFVSETRHGPMVHARLGIAEENSGKLVSVVRQQARDVAKEQQLPLVIIDGSPGIGCPVIASVTGADLVLIVTEPTLSGLHDLERVGELTSHFAIPTMVCINKHDLNGEMTRRIEAAARAKGMKVLGKLRYDVAVTRAQVNGKAVVEDGASVVADEMKALWERVSEELAGRQPANPQANMNPGGNEE